MHRQPFHDKHLYSEQQHKNSHSKCKPEMIPHKHAKSVSKCKDDTRTR